MNDKRRRALEIMRKYYGGIDPSDTQSQINGKNKLPYNAYNEIITKNGITIETNFGQYTVRGTATAYTEFNFLLYRPVNLNPAENKIAFLNTQATGYCTIGFLRDGQRIHYWALNPANKTAQNWTDTGNENINQLQFTITNGTTVDMTFSPMLLDKNETDLTWETYKG